MLVHFTKVSLANINPSKFCFSRTLCLQQLKSVSVLFSESCNVYENLAFENFLYENHVFDENKRILFLWRNENCVVIGRHQNPWKEVNLRMLKESNVQLCRRMSGGGSVFHDLGNLNFTFLTSKDNYNRIENLEFIISALKERYGLGLERNEKDDILLDNKYKVSGTAAKIGLRTAYHHCTLLCSTNLKNLSSLLRNPFGENIKTNATQSVKSTTRNLFIDGEVRFSQLLNLFASKFYTNYDNTPGEIIRIHPTNISGICEEVEKISSWDWIYGKSPKFILTNRIKLLDSMECDVDITINKGILQDFSFENDVCLDSQLKEVFKHIEGTRIHYNTLLSSLLPLCKDENSLFYCNQILSWFES